MPQTLLSFVNMLLYGPGNFESHNNQAALSISQLIVFNAVKRSRKRVMSDTQPTQSEASANAVRHALNQETPLLGLMLHCATRKKKIENKCHDLGLSVSYNRVLQIENKVTNSTCDKYRSENLVCPLYFHLVCLQ